MEIVQVSMKEQRRSIPVKGWGSVSKVLNTYANGFTRGAKATEQVTVDAIDKSHGSKGGLAVCMFLLGGAMVGGRSPLVDRLLKEAEERLKTQPKFIKDYDYDAMGTPFFKAGVDIQVLDREQDMYGVGICAVCVGDDPEQGLAEHFGIPRTLLSCSVEVETKPFLGNRFEFDFEPVLRKLEGVLDTKGVTGEQIVTVMMTKEEHDPNPWHVLLARDGLEVQIKLGRVASRMEYRKGKRRDTWSSKGSVLSGELHREHGGNDVNAKATPTFLIVVSASRKDDWSTGLPIWQPDLQEKAIDLANKIATALQ